MAMLDMRASHTLRVLVAGGGSVVVRSGALDVDLKGVGNGI